MAKSTVDLRGSGGWYCCSSYDVANLFSSFSPFSNSSIGGPVLSKALAGPLSRQPYQVSFSHDFFGIQDSVGVWWLYMGWNPMWYSLWMAFPLYFIYIFAPVSILFPFLEELDHPNFILPSSSASCGLWIVSWEFQAFGLISTISKCIPCVFFCDWVTLFRMMFSSSIHLP